MLLGSEDRVVERLEQSTEEIREGQQRILDKMDEGGGSGGGGSVTTNTTVNLTMPPPPQSPPAFGRQTSVVRLALINKFIQQFDLSARKTEEIYKKLTDEDDGFGMTNPQQFRSMDLTAEELAELASIIPRAKRADWNQSVNQIISGEAAPPSPLLFDSRSGSGSSLSFRSGGGERVHASFSSRIHAALLSQAQDAVFRVSTHEYPCPNPIRPP